MPDHDQKPTPTSITKHSDSEMEVRWSNGDVTVIPFSEIRFQCRCASCVDEWTRERRITRESVKPDIHPLKVEPVGRYAIQINWSDGHSTGIYPWDLLYKIARGESERGGL